MQLAPNLVPAEQQHRQETGFEEKGEDPLGRQGAAEDIPHVAGVGGPVGAELEFHHDARGDADGEGEGEDPGPEPGHLVIERVSGLQPEPLHDHQAHAQADAQRRVDVMERDGERELDAG